MSVYRFTVRKNGSSGLYDGETGELVTLPLRLRAAMYCRLTLRRLQSHGVHPHFWFWVFRRWLHRQWPKSFAAPPTTLDRRAS